jgi:class 3 adenylate cyclase
MPMNQLPSGTVTFLFTDVDHSTQLVKALGEGYDSVLAKHRDLLRAAFVEHGGTEVDTQGDAFFAAFGRARDAVSAAAAAQYAISEYPWMGEARVSVRMGLHTGEPYLAEHGYTGVAVHRAARICTVAHGGQVLLSGSTAAIIDDDSLRGISLRDLGEHELKDIDRPERIFQLVLAGLPNEFPPVATIGRQTPLAGTVTVVMAEGRRMMRLARKLSPEDFGAMLDAYKRLLGELLAELDGRDVDVTGDTAMAVFPSPKQAALAAVAAQRAVADHEWPFWPEPAISVGLHSGTAGIGWPGPAAMICSELCDAAEGGQILMSQATASLLEEEDLGDLSLRDAGEQQLRRSARRVHAYELAVRRRS